jgi:sialic acid synthase SpsE/protoporphyrinogen oxidase
MKKNIYIIGAGPSGLITALSLQKKGYSVTIYEQSVYVGGMCRTWEENDYLLDTGPHIYHTPDKELAEYWKKEFGEVLLEGDYWSKNVINGNVNNLIDYPLSWETIQKFEEPLRTNVLKELTQLDQNKSIGAKNFKEYVTNLVGHNLTEMFFTKYPKKVWGIPTSELTADWAPKRIEIRDKNTPFYFGQYAAVGKYGTGSVYKKIADDFTSIGGKIKFNCTVTSIVEKNNQVSELEINKSELIKLTTNDLLISTIPITILGRFLGINTNLKFRGIASVYVACKKNNINWPNNVHWLYFDDERFYFNRVTNSSLLSPEVCPKDQTLLTIESTYSFGDEIDLQNNQDFESAILSQLIKTNIINSEKDILFISSNKEPYVYPLQYPGYQNELVQIKTKIASISNLYSIGTGGDFNYADSQVLFYKAQDLVFEITEKESTINQTKKNVNVTKFNSVVEINGFKIGDSENCSPIIIGEIGLNHNGNYELAIKLIDAALDCDLKFVKLQTYTSGNSRVSNKVKSANYIEKITDQEESLSQMFDKYNLTIEQQISIFDYARLKGLNIFSTPFDIESAIFLNDTLKVDCFKIASVDLVNLPLIRKVASFGKPMILSCGMANLSEIESALDVISNEGNSNVILLHCNSSYPAPLNDMNLNVIKTLKSAFKIPIGLSDHTFGLLASTISLSIGANVIERHFTLDKFMEGPDHILSSEPIEMKELVNLSINIPKILGSGLKKIQPSEYYNINLQRKSLYANRNLNIGEILNIEDVTIKGPGGGILPKYLDIVIGRQIRKKIEKDYPITWEII